MLGTGTDQAHLVVRRAKAEQHLRVAAAGMDVAAGTVDVQIGARALLKAGGRVVGVGQRSWLPVRSLVRFVKEADVRKGAELIVAHAGKVVGAIRVQAGQAKNKPGGPTVAGHAIGPAGEHPVVSTKTARRFLI